jgi:hypothetical protein
MKLLFQQNVRVLFEESNGAYILKNTWEHVGKSIIDLIVYHLLSNILMYTWKSEIRVSEVAESSRHSLHTQPKSREKTIWVEGEGCEKWM